MSRSRLWCRDLRHSRSGSVYPFVYFHSLLDLGGCAADDVSLDRLRRDLRSASRTPKYSFIAPGVCLDSGVTTCSAGGTAGLAAEDAFLRAWVPKILRSAAYRKDGVLIIAFAHAEPPSQTGSGVAASPTQPVPTGALVLSPHAAHRNKIVSTTYDPYSLLRSVEELLGFKARTREGREVVRSGSARRVNAAPGS